MTVPRIARTATLRVADMVRAILPSMRSALAPHEESVGIHLRGNTPLYESLVALIRTRLDARASLQVPAEPIDCRASMERDHELRWLLSRLEAIYKSPVISTHDNSEPPA